MLADLVIVALPKLKVVLWLRSALRGLGQPEIHT